MRLGRRLSSGIAEDPPRVEEPQQAPAVDTPWEHEDVPRPVVAAAER